MPLKRKSTCRAEDIIEKIQKLEALVEDKPTEEHKSRKNILQIINEQSQADLSVQNEKKKRKPKTTVDRVLLSLGADLGSGGVLTNFLQKSHRKSSDAVSAFMHFVHERQVIYELKSSWAEPPYTKNVVMASRWFTNVQGIG